MSYFSAALERTLETLSMSRSDLVKATGIHRTSMSGYVRGTTPVGPRTLRTICAAVPEAHQPVLVRAWLLDQVPREMQNMVEITARTDALREDAVPPLPSCSDDIRRGLELLARKSVHPPVRDLILDLSRLLDGPQEAT